MCVKLTLCIYVLNFTAVSLVSIILKLMAEQVNSVFLLDSLLKEFNRLFARGKCIICD